MFIHWGISSFKIPVRWINFMEPIPVREFEAVADEFNPKKYNPQEWVDMALEAGMKYMVLTTRRHNGFALFDSRVSDFKATNTPAKRDLVAEFVDACRSKDMKIGFYYSLLDWRYPAYFAGPEKDPVGWAELLDYVHTQVKELCTNYGKIDILWYDGAWLLPHLWWEPDTKEEWQSEKLNAMVRSLQPHILINDRSGTPGDFSTPEQHIPSLGCLRLDPYNPYDTDRPVEFDPNRPWETCMTMSDSWGYRPRQKWKSTKQLIHNLARCAEGGGNYLLNVGPKPDGTFPRPAVKRLKEIGGWMKINGESIYGAEPCPFGAGRLGVTTAKGNTVYLHFTRWPGKETSILHVKNRVLSAYLLATGQEVDIDQVHYQVTLRGLP